MPDIICSVCGGASTIQPKNWKLLDPTSKYFCSRDCLLQAITECSPNGNYLIELPEKRVGSHYSKELGVFFMSRYEEKVAMFLINNEIAYNYEKYWFPVLKSIYIPDFYLPEYGCFLEVKGAYGVGSKNKLAKFRATYPNEILYTLTWNMRHLF